MAKEVTLAQQVKKLQSTLDKKLQSNYNILDKKLQSNYNTLDEKLNQILSAVSSTVLATSSTTPTTAAPIVPTTHAQSTMPPPATPTNSSSKRSHDSDKTSSPSKRPKKNEEKSSYAPSTCSTGEKEYLIGKDFRSLRSNCRVPIDEFHKMIDLEDLPPELAGRAYDELAKQLRLHPDPDEMNEATRQAVVHGLLVTVCDYVVSEFDIPKDELPAIEINKEVAWCYNNKPVNGKLDIGVIKNDVFDPHKQYYFMIEMKATTVDDGMKQGFVYLRRIRETNAVSDIDYGISSTLIDWELLSLRAGHEFKISGVFQMIPLGKTWDSAFRPIWIRDHSMFIRVLYTLLYQHMITKFKREEKNSIFK